MSWKCVPGDTCSADAAYKDGSRVELGDHVSTPRYPRGTLRGVVCQSPSFKCGGCGLPALRVMADDGTVYSLSDRARKLKAKT